MQCLIIFTLDILTKFLSDRSNSLSIIFKWKKIYIYLPVFLGFSRKFSVVLKAIRELNERIVFSCSSTLCTSALEISFFFRCKKNVYSRFSSGIIKKTTPPPPKKNCYHVSLNDVQKNGVLNHRRLQLIRVSSETITRKRHIIILLYHSRIITIYQRINFSLALILYTKKAITLYLLLHRKDKQSHEHSKWTRPR